MGNNAFYKNVNIPFNVSGTIITAISSNGFEVSDGSVAIYPQKPNLKGIIKDKSGNVVQDSSAWVVIKPASATEQDWNGAIWSQYLLHDGDSKILFKENLNAGQYKITQIGGKSFQCNVNIAFTVNADLTISSPALNGSGELVAAPPQPNASGTLYGDNGQPVPNGWVGIARYINGLQVSMDGSAIPTSEDKDSNTNIYWKRTIGIPSDGTGHYELKLDPGSYKVVSAGGAGIWYQPYTSLEIPAQGSLTVDIKKPGANVTLTVSNVPTNLAAGATEGSLNVYQLVGQDKVATPVKFEQINGGSFVFDGLLQDGTYTVSYFGTKNGGMEVTKQFSVAGSANVSVNLGTEAGMTIVNGTVTNSAAPVTERIWLAIQGTVNGQTVKMKVQTDDSGHFTFKLQSGTQWQVVEISTSTGYNDTSAIGAYQYSTANTSWSIDLNQIK